MGSNLTHLNTRSPFRTTNVKNSATNAWQNAAQPIPLVRLLAAQTILVAPKIQFG